MKKLKTVFDFGRGSEMALAILFAMAMVLVFINFFCPRPRSLEFISL